MVKAVNKEFRAEIKNSFSRFISILLIVALGVAFYVGLRSTEPDMRTTGDRIYDKSNMMDIKIISTMGLSDSDVEAVKGLDTIADAVGTYSKDLIADIDGNEKVVKFMAETNGINEVELISGNMPKNADECLLDKAFMENAGIQIGDTFTISSGTKDPVSDSMNTKKFRVVGSFTSTLYMSTNRGTSTIGNGTVNALAVTLPEAFKSEAYTEMYATVKGAKEEDGYSDNYFELVQKAIDEIDSTVKDACIQAKYDELYAKATDVIDGIDEKLTTAKDGKKQAQSTVKKLQKTIKTLDTSMEGLDAQIASVQSQIDNYDVFIDRYKANGSVPAGVLNANEVPISQLESEKAGIVATKEPLEAKKTELVKQKTTCQNGIKESKAKITELTDGITELDLAKADAEDAREEITSPSWYLLDRTSISSYVEYDQDADRINNIGKVFPVIFFLVAALVSLTTMTRMINEQRTQIGTMKALGYDKFTIAFKYIKYAMLATITGSVLGGLIGVHLFPTVILNAYKVMYPSLSEVQTKLNLEPMITATVISILCVLAATIFSSYATLRENAAELMRPLAPKVGKKILLERVPFIWKHLNFSMKSSIRNLVRYKKRFFMTLFGISGSMALIIVGFGLKDSTQAIVNKQYGEIHHYDASVTLASKVNEKRIKEATDFFDTDDRVESYLKLYQTNMTFANGKKEADGYLVVPMEAGKLTDYVALKDRKTQKKVSMKEDSVIIDEKLASLLEVSAGDKITLKVGEQEFKTVTIGGITENYLNHYVYMSPDLYQKTYGKTAEFNQIFLRTVKNVDTKQMTEDILSLKACSGAMFITTLHDKLGEVLKSIDIIVLVLIISAGGLAFVVLYNLNNINISERKRELATLKVLGFYDGEVSAYLIRENIMISIIGILVGCLLGAVLHQFVIQTAEIDVIMFGRKIAPISYLYSALITVAFMILINFTMHFKMKKIDMAESMKSVE